MVGLHSQLRGVGGGDGGIICAPTASHSDRHGVCYIPQNQPTGSINTVHIYSYSPLTPTVQSVSLPSSDISLEASSSDGCTNKECTFSTGKSNGITTNIITMNRQQVFQVYVSVSAGTRDNGTVTIRINNTVTNLI